MISISTFSPISLNHPLINVVGAFFGVAPDVITIDQRPLLKKFKQVKRPEFFCGTISAHYVISDSLLFSIAFPSTLGLDISDGPDDSMHHCLMEVFYRAATYAFCTRCIFGSLIDYVIHISDEYAVWQRMPQITMRAEQRNSSRRDAYFSEPSSSSG
jgi:hypothetical protein